MNDDVSMEGVIETVDDTLDKELSEFDELKGKYEHLRSEIGRYANQNAELLRTNNELLQKTTSPPADDWDFDPAEKKASEALSKVQQLELESKKRDLARDFPGYQEEASSEAFQNWVNASPYRQKRFQMADSLDFDAAREILTEWQERKSEYGDIQDQREQKRQQALNSASMEKGSAGGVGKKVWDRDWLVEQQVHNPGWYRANYSEIMQAYREGRVKKRR